MRKKTDRTNRILEILTEETKAEVAELSQKLKVSQVTIRKDLDELAQRGIIKREHGCAFLRGSVLYRHRRIHCQKRFYQPRPDVR